MIKFSWDDPDHTDSEWPIRIDVVGYNGEFVNFLTSYCPDILEGLDRVSTYDIEILTDHNFIDQSEYETIRAFLDISDIEYEDELHD